MIGRASKQALGRRVSALGFGVVCFIITPGRFVEGFIDLLA
jgi:hypothetical protein